MTRPIMLIAVTVAVLITVFVGGWMAIYRSPGDPKNIKYVLWKAGLFKINLDDATEAMVGDTGKYRLVVGKTEDELRAEFVYLLDPTLVTPYLRNCYEGSSWKDQKVLFIRRSNWMVVFSNGRASDLVLVKGC